jgi:hypothetical protein
MIEKVSLYSRQTVQKGHQLALPRSVGLSHDVLEMGPDCLVIQLVDFRDLLRADAGREPSRDFLFLLRQRKRLLEDGVRNSALFVRVEKQADGDGVGKDVEREAGKPVRTEKERPFPLPRQDDRRLRGWIGEGLSLDDGTEMASDVLRLVRRPAVQLPADDCDLFPENFLRFRVRPHGAAVVSEKHARDIGKLESFARSR